MVLIIQIRVCIYSVIIFMTETVDNKTISLNQVYSLLNSPSESIYFIWAIHGRFVGSWSEQCEQVRENEWTFGF